MRSTTLILFTLLFLGCTDATAPAVGVQGTWAANYNFPGTGLVLTLTQTDRKVSGSGTYAMEAGPGGTVQVDGTYNRPDVSLYIHYQSGLNETFNGRVVDATHMTGTLSDGLGHDSPLSFTRS